MEKSVYDNAVNVLLDAYNNETLFHGICTACAVGNIIASAVGTKIVRVEGDFAYWENGDIPAWYDYIKFSRAALKDRADEEINATGMTKYELNIIEISFEKVEKGVDDKHNQFLGLEAVLKVMETMVSEEVPHKDNMDKLETIKNKFVCILK